MVSVSTATNYFVNAMTGSDGNAGTSSGTAFKTITKALSVVANGDVISVAAGTYNKTLGETFPLSMVSGVTLSGSAGAATTIIDATGDGHRVLNCISNSSTTIVQGFTITGGYAIDTSSFTNFSKGGGIYIEDGSPIIQNNIITRDTVRGYDFYQPTGGTQGGGAYGGGLYLASSTTATIRNNVISHNIALGGGGKDFRGGWSGDGTSGGNSYGGGINSSSAGAALIMNNTFYGNKSTGGLGGSSNSQNAGYGGNANAGAIDAGGSTLVKNNIFCNNSAVGGTTGGGNNGSAGTSNNGAIRSFVSGNLSNNLYYNNTATTDADGATLGTNNISGSDPLFVSTTNYHFTSTSSPAYHAGTPTGAPSTDLDGTTRSGTTPSIGAYEGVDPLPVELIAFSALARGRTTELYWKTATEVNNYGFEIERRILSQTLPLKGGGRGGDEWTRIGFVEGNGTINSPKEYTFIDKNQSAGKYSYRLKQIDRDGKFEYSQQVEAVINTSPLKFELAQNFPNPFNPTTTIGFSIQVDGFITLKVYDVIGREVKMLVNDARASGSYSETFDAKRLTSGIYFARLTSNGKSQVRKLMLLK